MFHQIEKGLWAIELLVIKMTPEEKSNLQALARVDYSIVALVGQCVPLTGSQRKKSGHFYHLLRLWKFFRLCVFDNVPIPGLEDNVLVKLKAHIPS